MSTNIIWFRAVFIFLFAHFGFGISYVSSALGEDSVGKKFSFRNYDVLKTRQEKEAAAQRDLDSLVPRGSPVSALRAIVTDNGGYCKVRTYIPETDRRALPGDQIYCEVMYIDPKYNSPYFRVRWSMGVKYNKEKDTVENLKVHWRDRAM